MSEVSDTNCRKIGFLDLPAELRNQVYALTASSEALVLLPTKPHALPCKTPLLQVCRQVKSEYFPLLLAIAPSLSISVPDFAFNRVVAFVNKNQSCFSGSADRHICFKLSFTGRPCDIPDPLSRWLRRFEDSTKRSAQLNASYAFVPRLEEYTIRTSYWIEEHTMEPYDEEWAISSRTVDDEPAVCSGVKYLESVRNRLAVAGDEHSRLQQEISKILMALRHPFSKDHIRTCGDSCPSARHQRQCAIRMSKTYTRATSTAASKL